MSEILLLVSFSVPLISCMNIRPPEIYGFSPKGFSPKTRAHILDRGGTGLDDRQSRSRRAPSPIIAVAASKGEGAGSASKSKIRDGSPSLVTARSHVYNPVDVRDLWCLLHAVLT